MPHSGLKIYGHSWFLLCSIPLDSPWSALPQFQSITIALIPLEYPQILLPQFYLISSILQTHSKMSQVHSHCNTVLFHNSDVSRVYNTLVNQTTRCNAYLCLKVCCPCLAQISFCRLKYAVVTFFSAGTHIWGSEGISTGGGMKFRNVPSILGVRGSHNVQSGHLPYCLHFLLNKCTE